MLLFNGAIITIVIVQDNSVLLCTLDKNRYFRVIHKIPIFYGYKDDGKRNILLSYPLRLISRNLILYRVIRSTYCLQHNCVCNE